MNSTATASSAQAAGSSLRESLKRHRWRILVAVAFIAVGWAVLGSELVQKCVCQEHSAYSHQPPKERIPFLYFFLSSYGLCSWIWLTGGYPRPRIRIKNFGKTPARNVVVRMNGIYTDKVEIGAYETTKAIKFKKRYDGGRTYPAPVYFLGPTQQWGMWIHLSGGWRFNPHCWPPYNPNKEALLIWGAIVYDDLYDRTWVTDFCFIYDGSNRFLPYGKEHNREREYKDRQSAEEYIYGPVA